MSLIAKKPCSFGGRKFYIGDEIPTNLVADAKLQEKMGVITIINDNIGGSGGQSGTLFTREQVKEMIADAVQEAEEKMGIYSGGLQSGVLEATGFNVFDETIPISVKGSVSGENEQATAIPAKPEEIQQVFAIMQMNAEEGIKTIAEVTSENILMLLHAADSRKTIKDAAKKQADKLFSIEGASNECGKSKENTGIYTEGAGT